MTGDPCPNVRPDIEALASGTTPTPEQQAHLAACPDCAAELALARRIERVLESWPTPAPPAHFALTVAAATRRERWRQEQVVDWSFNLALGAALTTVAAGVAGVVWVLGTTAGATGAPNLAATAAAAALAAMRAQAPVVGTATVLLATTLGAWWWAEERSRW